MITTKTMDGNEFTFTRRNEKHLPKMEDAFFVRGQGVALQSSIPLGDV